MGTEQGIVPRRLTSIGDYMVDMLGVARLRATLPVEACIDKPLGKVVSAHEACTWRVQTHHRICSQGSLLGLLGRGCLVRSLG